MSPSLSPAFMALLNVCTNRSAWPFVEGWYGALRMCLMPLAWLNSWDVNCAPLSETICSGSPYRANSACSASIVF